MNHPQQWQTQAQHAVFTPRPAGLLQFTGRTRLLLLDRMSTQKVRDLKPGQGAATVLTTDIGRMIDRLILWAKEDLLLAVTGENQADPLARYFMRYIFFNDDVQPADVTSQYQLLGLYGAQTPALLAQLGWPTALPQHHWQEVVVESYPFLLSPTDPIAGSGYLLLVPSAAAGMVQNWLTAAGFTSLSPEGFEYLRLQAGLPLFGREITNEYIPLETGLWTDVSFHKGCYLGQEIIARMDSRNRIAKQLIQLTAAEPFPAGAEIVAADGKVVGTVTSAAYGLGLGYVKTSALATSPHFTVNQLPVQIHTPAG